jgi:preprotein translocase subunit YajC
MSPLIFVTTLLVLFGTITLVFAMRYVSQAYQARAQAAQSQDYRKLASDAVTAQSGNAATLLAIQSELAEIKTRMTSVEKILKAVE